MAIARIALSRAIIRDSVGTALYSDVSALGTAEGHLLIRNGQNTLLDITVQSSERDTANGWTVTATDGTVYLVEISRKRGCNCGS